MGVFGKQIVSKSLNIGDIDLQGTHTIDGALTLDQGANDLIFGSVSSNGNVILSSATGTYMLSGDDAGISAVGDLNLFGQATATIAAGTGAAYPFPVAANIVSSGYIFIGNYGGALPQLFALADQAYIQTSSMNLSSSNLTANLGNGIHTINQAAGSSFNWTVGNSATLRFVRGAGGGQIQFDQIVTGTPATTDRFLTLDASDNLILSDATAGAITPTNYWSTTGNSALTASGTITQGTFGMYVGNILSPGVVRVGNDQGQILMNGNLIIQAFGGNEVRLLGTSYDASPVESLGIDAANNIVRFPVPSGGGATPANYIQTGANSSITTPVTISGSAMTWNNNNTFGGDLTLTGNVYGSAGTSELVRFFQGSSTDPNGRARLYLNDGDASLQSRRTNLFPAETYLAEINMSNSGSPGLNLVVLDTTVDPIGNSIAISPLSIDLNAPIVNMPDIASGTPADANSYLALSGTGSIIKTAVSGGGGGGWQTSGTTQMTGNVTIDQNGYTINIGNYANSGGVNIQSQATMNISGYGALNINAGQGSRFISMGNGANGDVSIYNSGTGKIDLYSSSGTIQFTQLTYSASAPTYALGITAAGYIQSFPVPSGGGATPTNYWQTGAGTDTLTGAKTINQGANTLNIGSILSAGTVNMYSSGMIRAIGVTSAFFGAGSGGTTTIGGNGGVQTINLGYFSGDSVNLVGTTTLVSAYSYVGRDNSTGRLGTFTPSSDERLKKAITPIGDEFAMSVIRDIQPITFEWDLEKMPGNSEDIQFGFSAQNVQSAHEGLIQNTFERNGTQYIGVKDKQIAALLVAAVKDLDKRLQAIEQ